MTSQTTHRFDFALNRPGALIAAIPAVLGFVPEKSLVLVSITDAQMVAVMRVDLCDALGQEVERLARMVAAPQPAAVVGVIVDADGATCPMCVEDYRSLADALRAALAAHGIDVCAVHVVDRIQRGGRWMCVDGCGTRGQVDDPASSPLMAAAVVDGRRLYATRADLERVIAIDDPLRTQGIARLIGELAETTGAERATDPVGCARRGVRVAIAAVGRIAAGAQLSDSELAEVGLTLTDITVRDALYALAVGREAGEAEALWTLLARSLPHPWRVEALVLLAFFAYARGDGPLAGISLEEALRCDRGHRMADMLDSALQAGMRPAQIRELAATGYRIAESLGVSVPLRPHDGRGAD